MNSPTSVVTASAPDPCHRGPRTTATDRETFAQLYALTADRVARYVALRLRDTDRDAIEDVVQDAYCHALDQPELIHSNPIGGMLRLAAWACNRHEWSSRRYVRAAFTVATYNHHSAISASEPVRPPAGRITYAHILACLTGDQRRAIQLRYLDGLPRDLAAREMQRSLSAFSALEKRAFRSLRAALTPQPAALPIPR
jgi:RNA polymerase sigma-70 factor (ECF subfamily)